jgi:hypothetical protein
LAIKTGQTWKLIIYFWSSILELAVLMNIQYDMWDWTKCSVTTQYVRFYSLKHEIIQRQLFVRQEELPEEVLNSEYVRKYTNSVTVLARSFVHFNQLPRKFYFLRGTDGSVLAINYAFHFSALPDRTFLFP